MAEFAALSVAASILQVIDISARVAERLNNYRKKDGALPNVLENISNRLPALIDALGDTKSALEGMTDKARKAITPCIKGCLVQIKRLDAMMDKAVPKLSDSSRTRGFKAIVSVKYESDIKETDEAIRTYIAILAQHRILSSAIPDSATEQSAPTPSSTCPFEREPGFVERDVMNEVMSRCQPGTRLALKGIGGVGKSRIAIEHTYRIRDASPQTWVFWVSLDSVSATTRDFRKIAKAVRILGWDEKGTDIFTLVRDWLKDDSHGPWIMVLDNADDVDILTAPAPNAVPVGDEDDVSAKPQIREFITTSQNGSILVTSRNTEAAQMITGNCAYHIDVEEMNETEALALLKSKLSANVLYTEAEATELVRAVDCMPLAVSQIATNVSINYPRLTIQKAVEELKNPSQDTAQLLESSVHETSRDVHRSNSIVKTWHLSFQYVRESNPSAARLLSLMCLFDRQGIPEALLAGQYGTEATAVVTPLQPHITWWKRVRRRRLHLKRLEKPSENKKPSQDKHICFDDDWRVLTNFALIKTNVDGHHFNMHRLVQHTTKRWLDINGELKAWTKKYVSIMKKCFPKPEHDNWPMCQYLFPHAQQVALYHPGDESALEWASLMKEISDFAGSNGSWLVAEELGRSALATFEAITGNSEDALGCMHQMGTIFSAQNKYQEAEIMYRKAFEGREIVLPPDHPDTLDSANMLGGVLNLQKRYDEGQVMQMRALEGRERVFGPEHSETQFFLTRLVFSSVTDGRYEQAGRLQQRLHRIHEQKFGMESENTHDSLRGLALLFGMQGKLGEAEQIHRHIVDNKTKTPGPYSLETLRSINFLGEMLFKQGKLEEAAMRYQQAIEGCSDSEKAYEVVLHSMDILAQIFLEQGKLEEAEDVARRMIAKREMLLGPNNIDTLVGVHTLASILMKQKRYEEAVLSYERAYMGTMEVCGADHPDTKEFLEDLQQSKQSMLVWQRRDCCNPDSTKSEGDSVTKPTHPVDIII